MHALNIFFFSGKTESYVAMATDFIICPALLTYEAYSPGSKMYSIILTKLVDAR